ncbi:MAG: flippase [Candidatus Pacearchaeota archaeon]
MEENFIKEDFDRSLKKFVKTSFIILIGIFLSKIFAYIYRIKIGRLSESFAEISGSELYGLFSLAVSIITIIISITSLGLQGGLLRYISFYRGKKEIFKIRYLINFSIYVSLISSFIAMLFLIFSAEFISINIFHDIRLTIFLKWFSLTIPLSIFAGLFISTIQAYEEIKWYSAIRNIIDNGVKVFFLFLLIYLGFKVNAIILSYIIGVFAMFIISFFVCKRKIVEIFGKYNLSLIEKKKLRKEILVYSLPLILVGILLFLFTSTDSFIIGILRNVSDVGVYNTAIPIASLLTIVPSLFIYLFFPLITKEYAKNNLKFIEELGKQITKWIFLFNLPIFILIFLFPENIINIIWGSQYLPAINSLRFLAVGLLFYSVFQSSENLISMIGKSNIVLFNISICAIVNLILGIFFVKKYGISGAAFVTMIVYILWSLIIILQIRKYLSIIPIKKELLKIFISCVISAILLLVVKSLISQNLIIIIFEILFFFLVYFFLVLVTKSLDKNDIMIINTIKKKFLKN